MNLTCGHPDTPENVRQREGRGKRCLTCKRERQREIRAHARAEISPAQWLEREERARARRSAGLRRSIERQAQRWIDGDPSVVSQGGGVPQVVAAAAKGIRDRLANEARLSDPIEQAKTVLRRRYVPVVSMAVFGGATDRFKVGSRNDITQDEMLEMAGRAA